MEIALNPESKRKTSVAVSIKDGERKFGSDAMVVCVKSPKNCYYYLLDLLGKKIDHPAVKAYQARFPQYKLEADSERGTVVFRHDEETSYSVEELLGKILNPKYAYQPTLRHRIFSLMLFFYMSIYHRLLGKSSIKKTGYFMTSIKIHLTPTHPTQL